MNLRKTDPAIYNLIKREEKRQKETLMMIPSENMVSEAVSEAVGSVFGNKYSEGYPYKRFYQGQKNANDLETLTIERIKKLFSVEHVNVQPYSGSPANLAVYSALLNPGEKICGLGLEFGGHLTHGAKASMVSKFFTSINYGLDSNGFIDYQTLGKLIKKERPKMIVAGTTAYPRFLDWSIFSKLADSVHAYLLADISHIAGLVLGGVYPSPVPYVDIITSTTHKTFRGPRGAMIMVTKKGLAKDVELPKKIDSTVFPGLQGGPHLNTIAGIAVAAHEAFRPSFKKYGAQIVKNAKYLGKELLNYGFDLVSGGTDSHLLLIDLTKFKLLGNTFAEALEEVGIVVNKNAIPHDPNPPFYPSGIRLGTPGITSRGMKEKEMKQIAKYIFAVKEALTKQLTQIETDHSLIEVQKKLKFRTELIQKATELKEIHKKIILLCQKYPKRI